MSGMASATLGSDDPLWKSCANWLCRLQILPDNHRIILPDATMQDLAYALRDGVLLCHVASTLNPDSVDQKNVNQRPQMAQFLCMKNIRVFLTACRDFFQLKETDLFQVCTPFSVFMKSFWTCWAFQPQHLYHYTDFARVLHTLSKLSQCDTAQYNKPDISGFPMRYRSSPVLARKDQQEEEIYRWENKGNKWWARKKSGKSVLILATKFVPSIWRIFWTFSKIQFRNLLIYFILPFTYFLSYVSFDI